MLKSASQAMDVRKRLAISNFVCMTKSRRRVNCLADSISLSIKQQLLTYAQLYVSRLFTFDCAWTPGDKVHDPRLSLCT